MNLHQVAAGVLSAVNPWQQLTIQASTGFVVGPDGTPAPQYAAAVVVLAQVQALDAGEIQMLDALNIQGVRKKIYLNGTWNSLVRDLQKGGDLVTLVDGSVWLVMHVFEYWPDWTSAAIVRQDGS